MSWASQELEKTDLGDTRRKRRLVKIIEDLAAQPNASLQQACRDNAALQGLYDFWSNPRIGSSQIISGHVQSTIERCKQESVVLAIQDTTELDFKNHKHKSGLGHLSNPNAKGLKVHTTLCVSSLGVPLGLIDKQVWAREKKTRRTSAQLRREPIQNKESNCWLKGLKATNELIPEDVKVVTIADREADIFELFAQTRRNGSEFLIRACRRRSVKKDSEEIEKLQSAIANVPVQGIHKIKLQRTPRRKPRPCTLTLRWTSVELQPPVYPPNRRELEPMVVNALLAEEENPPPREKPASSNNK